MNNYKIKNIEFVKSSTNLSQCPKDDKPEYAFIGRSNVGKSSLINALSNRKNIAKTSAAPGKTITINHFIVDNSWYLTDLPGYGYAKRSKKDREQFRKMIFEYIKGRENLINLFVLIDSRIPPNKNDIEFINFLGENQIPFYIVFTKTDKIKEEDFINLEKNYYESLQETWEYLPPVFKTSSISKNGCDELLKEINRLNVEIN